jgi:hypothetical protein
LSCGILSVDDTVIDKPYSNPDKAELIDYFWSSKHKKSIKGLNLITLFYTDINKVCVPVNFRLIDKSIGKTKNEHFREMINEVLTWGLQPAWITGDSWIAYLDNLKCVRHHTLSFMFAVKHNRLVSVEKGTYVQIQSLEVPVSGLKVYLKGFGFVKIFRTVFKDEYRNYIMCMPTPEEIDNLIYRIDPWFPRSNTEDIEHCSHSDFWEKSDFCRHYFTKRRNIATST